MRRRRAGHRPESIAKPDVKEVAGVLTKIGESCTFLSAQAVKNDGGSISPALADVYIMGQRSFSSQGSRVRIGPL